MYYVGSTWLQLTELIYIWLTPSRRGWKKLNDLIHVFTIINDCESDLQRSKEYINFDDWSRKSNINRVVVKGGWFQQYQENTANVKINEGRSTRCQKKIWYSYQNLSRGTRDSYLKNKMHKLKDSADLVKSNQISSKILILIYFIQLTRLHVTSPLTCLHPV